MDLKSSINPSGKAVFHQMPQPRLINKFVTAKEKNRGGVVWEIGNSGVRFVSSGASALWIKTGVGIGLEGNNNWLSRLLKTNHLFF